MLTATAIQTQTLPVMEHFYTLQGEGAYTGQAAYFIRLGGCDVGCVWCDVKESWDEAAHPRFSVDEICGWAQHAGAPIAVITGGEPLLHNLKNLTAALQANGIRTHIETSGSSPLSGTWDWITLSPKKFKAPLPEVVETANELKIVVFNKHDFVWATDWAAQTKAGCKLYLQPEWDKAETVTPLIVDFIKKNPQWQLSLQTHKYIHVP